MATSCLGGSLIAEALEDIPDIEGFVRWQISKLGHNFTEGERADATAEGMALIYELHRCWDPQRSKRFSAYALTYFRRRMLDWWRTELRQSGRGRFITRETHRGGQAFYEYHGVLPLDDVELVAHGAD